MNNNRLFSFGLLAVLLIVLVMPIVYSTLVINPISNTPINPVNPNIVNCNSNLKIDYIAKNLYEESLYYNTSKDISSANNIYRVFTPGKPLPTDLTVYLNDSTLQTRNFKWNLTITIANVFGPGATSEQYRCTGLVCTNGKSQEDMDDISPYDELSYRISYDSSNSHCVASDYLLDEDNIYSMLGNVIGVDISMEPYIFDPMSHLFLTNRTTSKISYDDNCNVNYIYNGSVYAVCKYENYYEATRGTYETIGGISYDGLYFPCKYTKNGEVKWGVVKGDGASKTAPKIITESIGRVLNKPTFSTKYREIGSNDKIDLMFSVSGTNVLGDHVDSNRIPLIADAGNLPTECTPRPSFKCDENLNVSYIARGDLSGTYNTKNLISDINNIYRVFTPGQKFPDFLFVVLNNPNLQKEKNFKWNLTIGMSGFDKHGIYANYNCEGISCNYDESFESKFTGKIPPYDSLSYGIYYDSKCSALGLLLYTTRYGTNVPRMLGNITDVRIYEGKNEHNMEPLWPLLNLTVEDSDFVKAGGNFYFFDYKYKNNTYAMCRYENYYDIADKNSIPEDDRYLPCKYPDTLNVQWGVSNLDTNDDSLTTPYLNTQSNMWILNHPDISTIYSKINKNNDVYFTVAVSGSNVNGEAPSKNSQGVISIPLPSSTDTGISIPSTAVCSGIINPRSGVREDTGYSCYWIKGTGSGSTPGINPSSSPLASSSPNIGHISTLIPLVADAGESTGPSSNPECDGGLKIDKISWVKSSSNNRNNGHRTPITPPQDISISSYDARKSPDASNNIYAVFTPGKRFPKHLTVNLNNKTLQKDDFKWNLSINTYMLPINTIFAHYNCTYTQCDYKDSSWSDGKKTIPNYNNIAFYDWLDYNISYSSSCHVTGDLLTIPISGTDGNLYPMLGDITDVKIYNGSTWDTSKPLPMPIPTTLPILNLTKDTCKIRNDNKGNYIFNYNNNLFAMCKYENYYKITGSKAYGGQYLPCMLQGDDAKIGWWIVNWDRSDSRLITPKLNSLNGKSEFYLNYPKISTNYSKITLGNNLWIMVNLTGSNVPNGPLASTAHLIADASNKGPRIPHCEIEIPNKRVCITPPNNMPNIGSQFDHGQNPIRMSTPRNVCTICNDTGPFNVSVKYYDSNGQILNYTDATKDGDIEYHLSSIINIFFSYPYYYPNEDSFSPSYTVNLPIKPSGRLDSGSIIALFSNGVKCSQSFNVVSCSNGNNGANTNPNGGTSDTVNISGNIVNVNFKEGYGCVVTTDDNSNSGVLYAGQDVKFVVHCFNTTKNNDGKISHPTVKCEDKDIRLNAHLGSNLLPFLNDYEVPLSLSPDQMSATLTVGAKWNYNPTNSTDCTPAIFTVKLPNCFDFL